MRPIRSHPNWLQLAHSLVSAITGWRMSLGVASWYAVSIFWPADAVTFHINPQQPLAGCYTHNEPQQPPPPSVTLCPRCFCPIDLCRTYNVDVCLPVQPPFQQGPPATLPPAGQRPTTDPPVCSSEPSVPQPDNASAPPQQDNTPAPPPEPSSHSPPQEREPDHTTHGEECQSSASSSSSFESLFTQFSYDHEFMEELKAIEEMHFSKIPFKPSSSQPPPLSSQPPPSLQPTPPSSPFIKSSPNLTSTPTFAPSTESSLIPLAPDESLSPARRWVVFQGRIPGVYTSL